MKFIFRLLFLIVILAIALILLSDTEFVKRYLPPDMYKQIKYYKNKYLKTSVPSLPVDFWMYEVDVIPRDHKQYAQSIDVIEVPEGGYRLYGYGVLSDGKDSTIHSFYLPDGKKWFYEKTRMTNASMPAVVKSNDGKFRMYFKSFLNEKEIQYPVIKSAVSPDGLKFTDENGVRITAGKDEFETIKDISNPEIVKEKDGVRFYFDNSEEKDKFFKIEKVNGECKITFQDGGKWPWIYGAFSSDGLTFQLENITIKTDRQEHKNLIGLSNPSVIQLDNEYRMYVNASFSNPSPDCKYGSVEKTLLAVSNDGKNFTIVKELNITVTGQKVVREKDMLRLYSENGQKSYIQKIDKIENIKNILNPSYLIQYFKEKILSEISGKLKSS